MYDKEAEVAEKNTEFINFPPLGGILLKTLCDPDGYRDYVLMILCRELPHRHSRNIETHRMRVERYFHSEQHHRLMANLYGIFGLLHPNSVSPIATDKNIRL
jgi:hypothetical protein